jgi:ubiquitin-conjugating enzyme E2 Z
MNRNLKRILLDVKEMIEDPLEDIHYHHDEQNAFKGYACLLGPHKTPYEHGYYFFELEFPSNYPFSPPVVKFVNYDGSTRFNPNLYINGKVCLSILNTWDGEKWSACQSIRTILLTLTTLLNEEPLLNEPGITREHPNFDSYHKLIEYKNVEISILKYLQKPNLPYPFHVFHPILVKSFITHAPSLIQKFQGRPNECLHLSIFNDQYVVLNYKHLTEMIQMAYDDYPRT